MPNTRNPLKEIRDHGYPGKSLNIQTVINLPENNLGAVDCYEHHALTIATELMKPTIERMKQSIATKLMEFEHWLPPKDRSNCSVCVKVAIPSNLEDWVAEVMAVKTTLYTYGSFSIDHGKIVKDITDPLTSEQK